MRPRHQIAAIGARGCKIAPINRARGAYGVPEALPIMGVLADRLCCLAAYHFPAIRYPPRTPTRWPFLTVRKSAIGVIALHPT